MLNIKTSELLEPNQIADEWQQLEQKCESVECFVSWPWISTWLSTLVNSAKLFRVYDNQKLIALAIVCETDNKNIKVGFGKTAYLHKTGYSHLDEIWIEYNQALVLPNYELSAHQAIIDYLLTQPSINQVEFGVSVSDKISMINCAMKKEIWQQPSYSTKLMNWPKDSASTQLPQHLSKNFKRQLKRSNQAFRKFGELKLSVASTLSDKQAYLEALGELHKTKWLSSSKGFNNSDFVRFHHQLILQHPNFCQILKIDAGDTNLGYLYFFTYRQKAYFYMSGLQTFSDNKLKSGISCHYLAICHFAQQAFTHYDFMAGYARYKASFSERVIQMQSTRFFKSSIQNRLLFIAYKIKHIIFNTKH
ncbi:GNAT family N-acetyltransferase [Catenovulum adriaticum]|uniref:GNAT family N-acetyltransferase n=1 Tax=Catenovulum adriaticum TaxID=2984846 RepID=A0ABY7AN96_9ALTE|nr:GNAT family N-acetyltransferase [Catenovulum sp. TS8]WAJ70688.1 GNAT family N-acetyltransferase [Catenovulum sp. TS8]